MKIIYVPVLSDTPARVHRPTGTIFLNSKVWHGIEPAVQKIILAHEVGHYKLQTSSELEADKYAFENYALSEPRSLKALYRAVTQHLDMNNPSHRKRAKAQIIRILETDVTLGNNKAKKILETMSTSNASALVAQLKAENPGFTDEEIQIALYFATSLKSTLSGYSNATGKSTGLGKFFAKVGDKVGEFLQKPGVQKLVGAAGTIIGIPPAAVSAGMNALGSKIEAKSEAKLIKIGNAEDKAKIEAQQAQKAADSAKLEAERKAIEAEKLEAERKFAEATKLQSERKFADEAKSQAFSMIYGNTNNEESKNQKPGISITTWVIIALFAAVGLFFIVKKK